MQSEVNAYTQGRAAIIGRLRKMIGVTLKNDRRYRGENCEMTQPREGRVRFNNLIIAPGKQCHFIIR